MISFSFFFMAVSLLIIRELLKPAKKPYQIVYYMCAFAFGIMVVTSLFRIIEVIDHVEDRSTPVFSDTLFYFLANISQTLLIFSFLLLISVKIADRLEIKVQFQRKFFSIIAHDLNGPVGMMNTMLNLANKGKLMDSLEQHQMYVKVEQLSNSTYHLLNNLLHWSRNQMEDLRPMSRNFDLNKMIQKNINLFQEIADSKAITIAFDPVPEMFCLADVQMTDTVIRNLISNAIKFSYSGGIIRISIENAGLFRVLRITDRGTGMNDEVKKNLFKFMEKSSVPGTSGEKGTGLGLVLCKEFVELNNGSIVINSNPDEGTEVVVSLPAATSI
jgi:signal transduction histidine kinase